MREPPTRPDPHVAIFHHCACFAYNGISLLCTSCSSPALGRHDAKIFLDKIMTARVVPSALDPLNPSTLNRLHDADHAPSKKRKIEISNAAGQLATDSIVIRVSGDLQNARSKSGIAFLLTHSFVTCAGPCCFVIR